MDADSIRLGGEQFRKYPATQLSEFVNNIFIETGNCGMKKFVYSPVNQRAFAPLDPALYYDPAAVITARSLINLAIGLSSKTKADLPAFTIYHGCGDFTKAHGSVRMAQERLFIKASSERVRFPPVMSSSGSTDDAED